MLGRPPDRETTGTKGRDVQQVALGRSGRRCRRLSAVDHRPPLTKREDLFVFVVIATPIFLVTLLIATLVVVLGTR